MKVEQVNDSERASSTHDEEDQSFKVSCKRMDAKAGMLVPTFVATNKWHELLAAWTRCAAGKSLGFIFSNE